MAEGYGIRHALTEMGQARDDIVGRHPFKTIRGPTSLAHICLLCPNRQIVAIIQAVCGCDESTLYLMRSQGLGVWYIGSHH